jgi:hypothetical protein
MCLTPRTTPAGETSVVSRPTLHALPASPGLQSHTGSSARAAWGAKTSGAASSAHCLPNPDGPARTPAHRSDS